MRGFRASVAPEAPWAERSTPALTVAHGPGLLPQNCQVTAQRDPNHSAAGTWDTAGRAAISLSQGPQGPKQDHKYHSETREVT